MAAYPGLASRSAQVARTTRPPGRSTRCISRTASSRSLKNIRANWLTTTSTLAVLDWEPLGAAVDPGDLRSSAAGHGQHAVVGIDPDDPALHTDPGQRSPRQHAGSAADVEDAVPGMHLGAVEQA